MTLADYTGRLTQFNGAKGAIAVEKDGAEAELPFTLTDKAQELARFLSVSIGQTVELHGKPNAVWKILPLANPSPPASQPLPLAKAAPEPKLQPTTGAQKIRELKERAEATSKPVREVYPAVHTTPDERRQRLILYQSCMKVAAEVEGVVGHSTMEEAFQSIESGTQRLVAFILREVDT